MGTELNLYTCLIYALFILAGVTFVSLLFVKAPYGRYARAGWGPMLNSKVAWIIQESPSVIAFAVFFFMGEDSTRIVPLVFFFVWQLHYIYRTYIYPFRLKGARKNASLVTAGLAFLFTILNSYINARYLTHFVVLYTQDWLIDPRFIIGIFLFFTGLAINFQSDNILINLRRSGGVEYGIPQGGLFQYVSCPNYLGEIMEWTGWAIATWSLPGLCFAVWTFANLFPRALSHHKWYLEKFPDYPKERTAIIPFIT
jgi:3-oxo-5-alpha-steroid 4-dehydrogenase 1